MKVIVGLGNPGEKYARTRHNTGFLAVERLKSQIRSTNIEIRNNDQISNFKFSKAINAEIWQDSDWLLVKPQIFMNSSGEAVKKILKTYRPIDLTTLFVIHDDLDIPLGGYKIQFGRGPYQHGGLLSIEQHLKTKDFWRIRIGVRGEWYDKIKTSIDKTVAEDYLLKPFAKPERTIINQVLDEISRKLVQILFQK